MSRCFPFPPPGYQKTVRPVDGHLAPPQLLVLDKEKHKEKKHKKDKDKKEGKEKKDKDRSKDKHRDKKDRKEKNKDKKKDKSKDKSRESEGAERHGEAILGQKLGESSRKSEEIKDPVFREELVGKTQDEKGVENRAVGNFPVPNERSREGFGVAPALEKERTAVNRMRIHSIDTSRKNEGLGQQTITINQQRNGTSIRRGENINSSFQGAPDGFTAAPMVEKDRVKVTRPLSNSTDSAPRKEGMGQRINNISILVQKRTESPNKEIAKREIDTSSPLLRSPANAMQKGNGKVGRPTDSAPTSTQRFESPSTSSAGTGMDRSLPRSSIPSPSITIRSPSPSITIRRPNGIVRQSESFSNSTNKPNAGGLSPAMGKERGPGGRMVQNNVSTEQKLVGSKPSAVAREKEPGGRMLQTDVSPDQKLVGSKPSAVGREKEPGGRMLQNDVSTDRKPVSFKPPAVGRENDPGGRMLQNDASTDQKPKPPTEEKVAVGRAERVEKVRDGAVDVKKKEDKKRERDEKKKRKEKHKEKKREKEAKKEKEEQNRKEHDKQRENSVNDEIDSILTNLLASPSAPPVNDTKPILADDKKAILADENLKKRKNHEMNGYQQNHHEMRPTKVPRPAPSSNHVENGTASHVAAPPSSVPDAIVKTEKAERLPKKEEKVNGNKEAQRPPVGAAGLRDPLAASGNKEAQRPPVDSGLRGPLAATGNGAPSSKKSSPHLDASSSRKPSPHPDCKYLGQIYTIPEAPQVMMECEPDDQDWLFDPCSSTQSVKPKAGTEAAGVPQVWAEAVKIDPVDVIALPYVIPF